MRFILAVFTILAVQHGSADVYVEIPDGGIRGRVAYTFSDNEFYSFQQIPFAAPPVGDLRFKAPIPPNKYDGILDGTIDNNVVCYQKDGTSEFESEDCLYLNVYTGALSLNNTNPLLPVMFFFYGGAFGVGDCIMIDCGPEFLIDHGVIVVTGNYRLGPFGFLSTQDLVIPGNNGLKDQQLAIKWVHDNIQFFGGDPEKITIFGHSAGSASATYQILSKNSEGLFSGLIAQSGSFLCPWAYQRDARKIAFQTAGYLDDSFNYSNDSQALLDFLVSVPAADLDYASSLIVDTTQNRGINNGFFYAPVVEPEHEGAFLTEKMYVSLKTGNFVKVPTMIGIASEESIWDAADANWFHNYLTEFDENLDWIVPHDMRVTDPEKALELGTAIRELYTGGGPFVDDIAAGVRYQNDTSFARAIIRHAQLQAQYTDVYFYEFSYDGLIGNLGLIVEGADRIGHGEDEMYIIRRSNFGYDNSDLSQFPAADVLTHDRMLELWTNFAKYRNPTPVMSEILQNITWPKVSSAPGDYPFLNINDTLQVQYHPKERTFQPWVDFYESLGYDDFDTY